LAINLEDADFPRRDVTFDFGYNGFRCPHLDEPFTFLAKGHAPVS